MRSQVWITLHSQCSDVQRSGKGRRMGWILNFTDSRKAPHRVWKLQVPQGAETKVRAPCRGLVNE
jgi:hypothetical protein